MKLRPAVSYPWILWFIQLLLLLTSVYVEFANSHKCLDKCQCLWVGGKQSADCGGLALTTLPQISDESFANGIQTINLTRNNLVELKRNIFSERNLVNLQKIFLSKVGLEKVDDNAFYRLKILIELDLSSNSLKYIPSQSFRELVLLRSLDLSSNQISSVPKESFLNLSKLKTLSLERNRITFIDDKAFTGLSNLESLKLSDNYLINIESKALSPLVKVHSLTLSDNKWQCDCHMRPLRTFLLANSRINIPDQPKCVDSHQIWTHLGLDSFLCPPVILSNYSSANLEVSEGSTLKLECALLLDSGDDSQPLSIQWYWHNIPIYNNSKGCGKDCQLRNSSVQYFWITERIQSNKLYPKKLKISRLELSSVLSFNSGTYMCNAFNGAGSAQKNFSVTVTARHLKGKVTAAAASSESHYVNDGEDAKLQEGGTDKVVVGLVLGILFGIFLVLVLFGISVVLLCRRRQQKQNHINANSGNADDTELEKLTANSFPSIAIVNPIQKPPRLALEKHNSDYETPQVWLIKRNGNSNVSHNEFDGCTELLVTDNYDGQTLSTVTDVIIEPDLIHPSAYARDRLQVTDLDQLSLHSDGTEV